MTLQIAIIDQGIDINHDRLKNCVISGLTIYQASNGYEIKNGVFYDETGHGTGIAAIIHRMVPEASIYAVKISSFDKKIREQLLIKAILACLENKQVRVINISMGIATNNPSPDLYLACEQAFKSGVVIAAATYNYPNAPCYPAHFPIVYGVSTGFVKNKFEYGTNQGSVNILAMGTIQRVATLDNKYRISSGTSYATAHFTGIVSRIIIKEGLVSQSNLQNAIERNATPNIYPMIYFRDDEEPLTVSSKSKSELDIEGIPLFTNNKIPFASRVAVFAASEKEMLTLLNFKDHVPFYITALIDYPVKLNANSFSQQYLSEFDIYRDIEKIDFEKFDTLILGYFLDQPSDANTLFALRLLEKSIRHNKNMIFWDTDVYEITKRIIQNTNVNYKGEIYVSHVTHEMFDKIKQYKNLPYIKTPVIAVVGTSNKQGKITCQLRLKEILQNSGYKVSHISTEPQGIALGSDFVFPYGFKNPIEPAEHEWSKIMRIVMRGVQYFNKPDIIITGIQGGLLPRSRTISNEMGHDLSSLHFLLGIQPDYFVLMINPNDDPKFIKDTINVISIYCRSRLLFCCLTPWEREFHTSANGKGKVEVIKKMDIATYVERSTKYSENLSVPVVDIKDRSVDDFILKSVQNAFS